MPPPRQSAALLLDTRTQAARARMLAAAVDILLAAGDLEHARAAATELSTIASAIGASLLNAASAQATGVVLLAEGDVEGAATWLCQASEIWRDLGMPCEEGQCLLMAGVCERRGDHEGRRLDVEAARRLFKQLNADMSRAHRRATNGPRVRRSARSANARHRCFASLRPARRIAPSPRSCSSARRPSPVTSATSSTSLACRAAPPPRPGPTSATSSEPRTNYPISTRS